MNDSILTTRRLQADLDYRRALKLIKTMEKEGLISKKERTKIENKLRRNFPPYLVELWP